MDAEADMCRYVDLPVQRRGSEYFHVRIHVVQSLTTRPAQNTYSTALAIGEKAAIIIAEELGIAL